MTAMRLATSRIPAFLDRRIDNVLKVFGAPAPKERLARMPGPFRMRRAAGG